MVTDMLGTPVDVGHYVYHRPTGKVYLVQKVSRVRDYGQVVSKVTVRNGYNNLVLTDKNIVRCLPDGKFVVDKSKVHVLD